MSYKVVVFVLFILLCVDIANGRIFSSGRSKRQTVVSSNADSNGTADSVENSAAANNYRTIDGTIGVNVSAAGNASGANYANITGQGFGSAGSNVMSANGDVASMGTNSQSSQDIEAAIFGNNMSVTNNLQGQANGVGDTSSAANGSAMMMQGGQGSPMNSNNSQATAQASGSLASNSAVILNQILSWDTILAQLGGSAIGQGLGSAYAASDIGTGNAINGVEGNNVISGLNSGNGNVNSQVNLNGQVNNTHHVLESSGFGSVNGSGNSTLVQASNLQSNVSGVNKTVSLFGDTNINSDGDSAITVNAASNLDNQGVINGTVGMNGTSFSDLTNMTVQTGVQANEGPLGFLGIGNGGVEGVGNQKSNSSVVVDSNYSGNGQGSLIVKGQGSSLASGNNDSALDVHANADLANTNGIANTGMADSSGIASGANSSVNGTSFLNVNNNGTGGSSVVEANGWGPGNSSVLTNSELVLHDQSGATRNASVQGSVGATGDNTNSYSISVVTDQDGRQSIANYQNATSIGSGSGSAAASNTGILKRKKRYTKSRNVDRLGRMLLTML